MCADRSTGADDVGVVNSVDAVSRVWIEQNVPGKGNEAAASVAAINLQSTS